MRLQDNYRPAQHGPAWPYILSNKIDHIAYTPPFESLSIAMGSTLNIAVPMDDWKENLELVGEAMWVKEADNKEGYWVGLELEDTSREDMEKWFKVVYRLKK